MDLKLTFNENVVNYDNIRPTYPDELFEDIFTYANLDNYSKLLEIGIGTGQATLPFFNKGFNITAIDIGYNLCEFVKKKFVNNNFQIINDDFMKHDFQQGQFDLIYSATAFHWLPKSALNKCKSILKENGVIALFWNHPFPNRIDDISNRINREVYSKYRHNEKKQQEFSKSDCDKRISELKEFGFSDIDVKLYHRKRVLTSDEYIALLNTYSDHIALPIEIKQQFESDMKNQLDNIGGRINIYDTIDLYLAKNT